MLSSFRSSNPDLTPDQIYQLALEQKTKLSQQLQSLVITRQTMTNISQEDHLAIVSQFNIHNSMLMALEQNIQELTNHHPHLLRLPSGPMTGDHSTSHERFPSSGSSFSFSSNQQFTFHPGVCTKPATKQDKRNTLKLGRK